MPAESIFPAIEVPKTDLFSFLFDRKEKPFPDDKVILRDATTGRKYTWLETRNAAIEFGKGLKGAWEWRKGTCGSGEIYTRKRLRRHRRCSGPLYSKLH